MELSKENLDGLFKSIELEIKTGKYQLPEKLLRKIDRQTAHGRQVRSYVEGSGGYYYQFLPLLVRMMQPRHILELGNFYGLSTTMMYSELPDNSRLTTIDIAKDQRYVPEEVFQDKRVRFIFGDDLDVNSFAGDFPMDADLVYIDTLHVYRQIKDEYDIYKYMFAPRTLVLMDDIHVNDMEKFFNELPFAKWDLTSFCHVSGFGAALFERPANFPQNTEMAKIQAAAASTGVWRRIAEERGRQLENSFHRRLYRRARNLADGNPKAAKVMRGLLKPIKRIYTPKEI